MNREEARRRVEETSNFKFEGGRVLITDVRLLATLAQLRGEEPVQRGQLPLHVAPELIRTHTSA